MTVADQNIVFIFEASQTYTVTARNKFSNHNIIYILIFVLLTTKSEKNTQNNVYIHVVQFVFRRIRIVAGSALTF